jgi:uncharacterized repeat protein (TIGR01451 family)/fimbrial isopeptide formation D2 family protein
MSTGRVGRTVARGRLPVALLIMLSALTTCVLPQRSAAASPTLPFTARYTTNANGAIVSVGNSLLTCPSSNTCAAARAGTATDNNNFTMVNADADADAATDNSSMSQLNLPAGSTVLWAGLYWGARLTAGTGGQPGRGDYNTMLLGVPGAPGYQTITASTAADAQFGPNPSSYNAYQRFADITALVQAAGNGQYWGGNVVAATGQDRYAGWAMTVVYSGPGLPLRNLTVFDGFNVVSSGSPQTIRVSGFQAPLAGTVDTQLSMVVYEGDLAQTGDYTRLNNTQLATGLSPGSNFFNSSNDFNGSSVTTRNPADRNQLGFDVKNLGASGTIPNGATSATFTFSSNGDVYYPGVLTTAINLYAPDFTASSKTVVNLNGNNPARPGDTLQFTLTFVNTGQDPAIGVVSEDSLPANTTFVPGSLQLLTGPGSPANLSDAVGDDRGEIDGRTVRVRLGTGGSGGSGGTVEIGQSTSYTFRVTLDDAAGGTTISNLANLNYQTGTTHISATYTTSPISVDVINRADVSVAKNLEPDPSAVGNEIIGTITVTNNGPNTATAVTLRDPLIDGWTNDFLEVPPGVTCTVDTVINCLLGDVPSGRSVVIRAHGRMASGTTQPSMTNVASVSTTSYDPDLTNNVASDTVSLVRVADLAITKTVAPASAPAGGTVGYPLTITNNGPSDAQNVVITDSVDNAAQLTITNATGTTGGVGCSASQGGSLRCTAATLAAGASATVTVNGILTSSLAAGTTVGNTATVTSGTADPNPSNNSATARVTVGSPVADVRLTKTAPRQAAAGGAISYAITATNYGPSDATGVTVTDTLPAAVTASSATTNRGTCTISGQTVTCTVATLPASGDPSSPAGASTQIRITGTVAGSASGSVFNTASVSATGTDPDTSNNSALRATIVAPRTDITVRKTANRSSIPAGPGTVVYTIEVTNLGPSTATGVQLRDLVPSAFDDTVVSTSPDHTCTEPAPVPDDPAHDEFRCDFVAVPAGVTRTLTVTQTTSTGLPPDPALTETVSVGDLAETNVDNNTASWTLHGSGVTDLSIVKQSTGPLVAGQLATYLIDVQNNVTEPAAPPTVTDTLPAGLTFVPAGQPGSLTSPDCTAIGQTVTCTYADPVPGATDAGPAHAPPRSITVQVDPGVADLTTVENTATVSTPSPEASTANNSSTTTDRVSAQADVAVTGMTITPQDPAYTGPGSWRTISFTLTNNGPSTAHAVAYRVSLDADAGVALSQLGDNCTIVNQELVCTISEVDLAPGQSVTKTFPAVIFSYVTPGEYEGRVHVSSGTPDPNLTNNDDRALTTVGDARTNLLISKAALDTVTNPDDGHQAYIAGDSFAFQITLSTPSTPPGANDADAQNVVLTDTMPAGFRADQVSTTRGACAVTGDGTGVRCELGTVPGYYPAGQTAVTVTVYGTVDVSTEGEQITNTATATSSTPTMAGTPTSVDASVAVDVIEQADLRLFKSADAATFYAGGLVGFTLTTVNAGPSDVEHASVTDDLPVGLTLDTSLSPGCTVVSGDASTGQRVQCVVGAVGVGSAVSIRVVAATDPYDTRPPGVPPGGPGDPPRPRPITDTATVTSQATDPDPSNNTASAGTQIDLLADLAITASVSTTTPAAGGLITYTAVTINNGPSVADNPRSVATFPPGFVPVSWDIPDSDCSWSPQPPADPDLVAWSDTSYTLTCVAIDVPPRFQVFPPGYSVYNQVTLKIPADTPAGNYAAAADLSTTTAESDYDNNHAELTVTVQLVSDTRVVKTLVEPNPMIAGRPATWRITATNDGPSVAHDVVISDVVPAGMSFVSASVEGGSDCPAPEIRDEEVIVKCTVATLGVGESVSALITFDIDPGASGELCNAALVGSGSLDPDADDNEGPSCGTTVSPPATDVGLTITADTPRLRPGEEARFTAIVGNNGPELATDVVVTIDVPPGLTGYQGVLVSKPDGSTAPATCVVGSLICTVGDLEPGQRVVYRITGTVNGSSGDVVTLTGVETHGEPDLAPGNDTSSADVTLFTDPAGEPGSPVPTTPPAAPPAGAGPDGAPGTGTAGDDALAGTGADVLPLIALGVLAIVVGAAIAAIHRRRAMP